MTTAGINNELVSTLECARLNRQHETQSLAIPEASVLHMARQFVSQYEQEFDTRKSPPISVKRGPFLPFLPSNSDGTESARGKQIGPSPVEVLKGIAPSLEFIVNRHSRAFEAAKQQHALQSGGRDTVSLAARPNTWENPLEFSLDP